MKKRLTRDRARQELSGLAVDECGKEKRLVGRSQVSVVEEPARHKKKRAK